MTAPNPVQPAGSGNTIQINPEDERRDVLYTQGLILDGRWSDSNFQKKHIKLYFALTAVRSYMEGSGSEADIKKKVDAWVKSPEYKNEDNKEFYGTALKEIHGQLAKFQSVENSTRAAKVREALPALPKKPADKPADGDAKVPDTTAAKPEAEEKTGDHNLSFGLTFQNDTGPSALLGAMGIPLDAFMTEKNIFTLKVPITFSMGKKLVGLVRPYGGMFNTKGIPGSGVGEIGTGYRAGVDLGFVNPHAENRFEAAGLGLEVTGVASSAADENGLENPGPLARLHFFKQDNWDFGLGKGRRFHLGLHTLLNHQESYISLGDGPQLLPEDQATSFSVASNIFVKSPFRLLGFSFRYYPHGSIKGKDLSDTTRPFRPGEGMPKVASVVTGSIINRNRRRDIPVFANSRYFLGLAEPLGDASRDQFDTIGLGLTVFSAQDGWLMAGNAMSRSEIYRRGTWAHRIPMLIWDGGNLIADIALAATTDDVSDAQTEEEYAQNPGFDTDFRGRAGALNLYLSLGEYALMGLDASGAMGRLNDKKLVHYGVATGLLTALGVTTFFLSAPMSGSECGPQGGLLRCGFGSPHPFFAEGNQEFGSDNIKDIERQYIVSTLGSAALSMGIKRVFLMIGEAKDRKKAGDSEVPAQPQPAGQDTAFNPYPAVNVQVNTQGGGANATWRF